MKKFQKQTMMGSTVLLLHWAVGCITPLPAPDASAKNMATKSAPSFAQVYQQETIIDGMDLFTANGLERTDLDLDRLLATSKPRSKAPNIKSKKFPRPHSSIRASVKRWIFQFTIQDRMNFIATIQRGEKYRPMIEEILKSKGLPLDLYYLAMIESGFDKNVSSPAQAVGLWQFIEGTALRYGLKITPNYDGRRNAKSSTIAAAAYLSDLHEQFHSWHLALAAYNAGENCISRAIEEGKTRDFWQLAAKGLIPRETIDYIPKFLAVVIIAKKPGDFGIPDPRRSRDTLVTDLLN